MAPGENSEAVERREPRVSVVIPCYNLGVYLDEAVESVLAQSFRDYEILIVDDGSTDGFTRQLLSTYRRPQTQVFSTPNRGVMAARNFLLSRASGEFVCALDADDRLHPDFLDRTVSVLERNHDLSFVSTHLQMFGDESDIWPRNDRCDFPALLCDDTVITAALVRRSALVKIGGYDEHMPHQGQEDWDLWISLVEAGCSGVVLPDVLFFYRRRRGGLCQTATSGSVAIELCEFLLRKHAGSYSRHFDQVSAWKDMEIERLQAEVRGLEQSLARYHQPVVNCRRMEWLELKAKLMPGRTESDT